jgi:hypothetical protein
MRNDARPIGENSPASPVGGDEARRDDDSRDLHKRDRQSHVVNRQTEEQHPDPPEDPTRI